MNNKPNGLCITVYLSAPSLVPGFFGHPCQVGFLVLWTSTPLHLFLLGSELLKCLLVDSPHPWVDLV